MTFMIRINVIDSQDPRGRTGPEIPKSIRLKPKSKPLPLQPLNKRKGYKTFSVLLLLLVLTGAAGVFITFPDLNQNYEGRQATIHQMTETLTRLETRIKENKSQVQQLDLLKFKANALAKRYPVYSGILDSVYDKSMQYGFQPELVLSIVKVESGFKPQARSFVGACGLMQVNVPVWRQYLKIDESRIYEVDYNIDLGLRILKMYYDESDGNMKRALHLYNNGYLHNNTGYALKVNATAQQLKPAQLHLSLSGF